VVASEITRLRIKARENRTIFASEQNQSLPAWNFHGRPFRFPDLFGRVAPTSSRQPNEASEASRTCLPGAEFSIKNQFRVPNGFFDRHAIELSKHHKQPFSKLLFSVVGEPRSYVS